MHYLLEQPMDFYRPHAEKVTEKMTTLHWLCDQILNGPFAYDKNVTSGGVCEYVKTVEKELGLVTEHWGFVKKKVGVSLSQSFYEIKIS